MSSLEIKISEVKELSSELGPNCNKVSSIADSINSVWGNLDSRITARRNISLRLSSAYDAAKYIQTKLEELQKFIDDSMDRYEKAENKVNNEAEALMFFWNIEYGGEFALEWNGMMYDVPGNSLLNKEIHNDGGISDEEREEIINKTGVTLTALSNINTEKFFGSTIIEKDGLKFKLFKSNGNLCIKVWGVKPGNEAAFLKTREMLIKELGGTVKQNKHFTAKLINDGVPFYDESGRKEFKCYNNKIDKVFDGELAQLDNYIKSGDKGTLSKTGDTFKSNMKPWEGFKDFSTAEKLTKFGKIAGDVGIVLTVADDFNGEFSSKENYDKSFGTKLAYSGADVGVDLTAGSAAMATGEFVGETVGSFFVPPIGTVVGAGVGVAVGFGVNWAINTKGKDGKSPVDHVKDVVKHPVKSAEEFGGFVKNTVCSWFS